MSDVIRRISGPSRWRGWSRGVCVADFDTRSCFRFSDLVSADCFGKMIEIGREAEARAVAALSVLNSVKSGRLDREGLLVGVVVIAVMVGL